MNIKEIETQEEKLQLERCDNQMLLDIGLMMLKKAKEEQLRITIDITRCGQQIFHAALPGTSIDNDEWLKRKVNSVYRFGKSSMALQVELEECGKSLEEAYHIKQEWYAAAGGAFPIKIKNDGLIGTVAVSGMSSEEDHNLVVECLEKYLEETERY